ncbi:hypothetical protein EHV15_07870 [Paenibacillus oralis]|uniref:Uncharacterized protein n=1 Tax=Paenibacillus oralis TaxID=2490856 RepID=A0A3P3TXK8_9BACL|nr:hypothetical protein [Paenibacillus oralis]RRJ62862.1 hypothetical protein EHV15_07870 [Paenibacillus oralis]
MNIAEGPREWYVFAVDERVNAQKQGQYAGGGDKRNIYVNWAPIGYCSPYSESPEKFRDSLPALSVIVQKVQRVGNLFYMGERQPNRMHGKAITREPQVHLFYD